MEHDGTAGVSDSSAGGTKRTQGSSLARAILGRISKPWVGWLQALVNAINALSIIGPNNPGYFVLTPDLSGNVQIDLANGLRQRLVGGATNVTILDPIWTDATILPGMSFIFYYDTPATGTPGTVTFTTGTGGFAADVQTDFSPDPTASTRTSMQFTYDGNLWGLDAVPRTGGSTT
jgi:hypothetical protein